MRFSHIIAAASLLAFPALAAPAREIITEVRAEVDIEVEFSPEYERRMGDSQAHKLYKQALMGWKKAQKIMWDTLTIEGEERVERLDEAAFTINESLNILLAADKMNEEDNKYVRRHWVQYEINHLKDKLTDAKHSVMQLPNLCFVSKAYNFVCHATAEVAVDIVAAAITVPVVTVQVLAEAAHKVHRCLFRMKEELKWEVERLESAIKYVWEEFEDEVHRIGRKIRHEAFEIGVRIKCGFRHLGHLIRADFHHIKEKIKDAFHHHHEEVVEEEYSIQEVVASGAVKVDIEVQWKEVEAKRRYKECATHVREQQYAIKEEIQVQERGCLADKWD